MMRILSHDEKKRFLKTAAEKVRAASEALSDAEIQSFSDLDEAERSLFRKIWLTLPDQARINLFERLLEAFERDDLFDFSTVIRAGLDDPEAAVRLLALKLAPADACGSFLQPLTELIHDRNEAVRVMAIRVLGRYIGERVTARKVQPRVSEAIKALESISRDACGRTGWALMEALALAENPAADAMISKAIHGADPAGVAAALRAVRYSLDDRWTENVLAFLDEEDPEILAEAIGAAGALRLKAARETLMKLLLNFEKFDPQILAGLILALANIGGSATKKILSFLEEALSEDSDLIEILEEARDLFEIAEYERSLDPGSDEPDEPDDSAEAEWDSDEDYLDQLALKIDLYLERNGLLTDEDDGETDGEEGPSSTAETRFNFDSAYDGDFYDDGDEEEDEYGRPDDLSFLDSGAVREKKRTFMDWTDEEVAAFRAAHEGENFDWEAFINESGDAD